MVNNTVSKLTNILGNISYQILMLENQEIRITSIFYNTLSLLTTHDQYC